MNNVFNAEFYKATRKKSIFICMVTAIVIGFILTVPSTMDTSSEAKGVIVHGKDWFYAMGIEISSFMFIFALIIPAMVLTSEFNDNTMKNALFSGISRIHLYLSKIIVMGIILLFLNLILSVVGIAIVTGKNGWGSSFEFSYMLTLLGTILRMAFVMFAYSCIFSLIGLLARNLIGSIALSYGVRLTEGLLVLVANNVKWLGWVKKIILGNMDAYFLQRTSNMKVLLSGTFWCALIIAVTVVVALIVFERQDIKS